MRVIDADALYELLDGGYDLDFDEVPETKRELLRMISVQPTIEERKSGRWELIATFDTQEKVMCSECGDAWTKYKQAKRMNYCPNCGADMRGGEE